jgi:Winged helix-turn-helix domain (DUF2582)
MQEEIGKTAGAIWDALNTRGEQSLSELKKAVSGKREGTHLRLGHWMAGARKPDCDHAREALLPNPLETRARKGDGRLVG